MTCVFYFDFGSPNAYLCHRAIPAIEARTGVRLIYRPVLLGGIFKLTGNQSPVTAFAGIVNKPEYERLETQRFLKKHGITDFKLNPHFPINTLQLMRGAIAAEEAGVFEAFVDQIYNDIWIRGRKMDEPEVYAGSLTEAGLPTDEILRLARTDAVKATLMKATEAAVEAGVFGVPSFLVGGELFFGKERLRDVEEEIVGGQQGCHA